MNSGFSLASFLRLKCGYTFLSSADSDSHCSYSASACSLAALFLCSASSLLFSASSFFWYLYCSTDSPSLSALSSSSSPSFAIASLSPLRLPGSISYLSYSTNSASSYSPSRLLSASAFLNLFESVSLTRASYKSLYFPLISSSNSADRSLGSSAF